jgi:enoyl-CoA hydratase/carnithine racemase
VTDEDARFEIERRGAAGIVTINRPEKLNAMDPVFFRGLPKTLAELALDPEIHAAVITGAGRAFSAGGDMDAFRAVHHDVAESRRYLRLVFDCFRAVESAELPVIGAVNGIAFGGGAELTLACDLAIASDQATFGFREATVGLMPGFGVIRAPEVIGRPWTRWLAYTADIIDAAEALQLGLVQKVVPHEALLDEACAIVERIAKNAPLGVRVAKQIINRGLDHGVAETIEATAGLYATEDHKEGIAAFLEKRDSRFTGR